MPKKYIDADNTLSSVDRAIENYAENDNVLEFISEIRYAVIGQPGADVEEVRHGEWICESHKVENMPNWNKWYCSECKVVVKKGWSTEKDGLKPTMLYCSECGAKMDKEKEE